MISPSDRSKAVELIDEAVDNGATLAAACREAGINLELKPLEYSKTESGDYIDRRTTCKRPYLRISLQNWKNEDSKYSPCPEIQ